MAKGTKIKKFSNPQRLFHWLYGCSWIALVLTGMIFVWRPDPHSLAGGLGPLLQGSVGQGARFLHRIAALVLMASPLVWLLGDRKTLLPDLKELLIWTPADVRYMMVAPVHYTTGKGALPAQGKYNGGHKMNFDIVLLTFVGFAVSGLTMWFGRGVVSTETFKLMQLIHSICFWGGLCMGLLHMYLTVLHPFTKKSLTAMTQGFIDLAYARAEHKNWVEQELSSGKAELKEARHS